MKELNKYSRVAAFLEKMFDELNTEFFEGKLSKCIITIQDTPAAYGHYSIAETWSKLSGETMHEINIGAGTLDRPIENTLATLIHEMVHHYNMTIAKVQDCSRGGYYHNKKFKEQAEKCGLIIHHADGIGWSVTEPGDGLLNFCITHDILDIKLSRSYFIIPTMGTGSNGSTGTARPVSKGKGTTSHSTKYSCPCCRMSVRGTKKGLHIRCIDCEEDLIES